MSDNQYYDGTKLLSLLDINKEKPEIYMCTTNRSAGKTTYFNRLCLNRFLNYGEKFCLVYRFNYELDDVAGKFFKQINSLFFPNLNMYSVKRANGIYHSFYVGKLNDDPKLYKHCGYAIALNSADQIKKNSHFFSDVSRMLFDEFQSESDHYCTDEVTKLISVHTSIARGPNKQVKYVPTIMLSNTITIINPYYVEMGISERLKHDTVFLRGDGFVLEQGFYEGVANEQKESAFNRAFGKNRYVAYASQNVYLNDNYAFIERPTGKNRYLCTLKYKGCEYGVREYFDSGVVFCDRNFDATFPLRISVTTDDHNINYVMLKQNEQLIWNLRFYFEHGCFRFKDLKCKEALLKTISY